MIYVTIKSTGTFIDRPKVTQLTINEADVALEKKNEITGKFEKVTVGLLYDIFTRKRDYVKNASDPEDHITPMYFESWFRAKYLQGKSIESRIISIEYKQINEST